MSPRRIGAHPEQVPVPSSRKLRVLLIGDPDKPQSTEIANKLVARLGDRVKVLDIDLERSHAPIEAKPDLVVVMGGDGAMITAVGRLGKRQVPVLGVNLGSVGFLAGVSPDRAEAVIDMLLEGKARLEDRAMMHVRVRLNGEIVLETHVLNEVLVDSAESGMVHVDLTVDRRPVCTYRGDGLIVATATGSTAYSLAAGGPILSPRLEAWVVTPLAPHMLTQRPLVLPGERIASLKVHGPGRFVADGHLEQELDDRFEVRIGPSRRRLQLVVDPEAKFWARLRSKLHWGLPFGPG